MDCNYTHVGSGVKCTVEAVFVLERHGRVKRVCEPIAKQLWTKMREKCYDCRRPKWTHWDITPIEHVEVTA